MDRKQVNEEVVSGPKNTPSGSDVPDCPRSISLTDFILTLFRHKVLIISIVVTASLIGIVYTVTQDKGSQNAADAPPTAYYSECAIVLPQGDTQDVLLALKSRTLAQDLAAKYRLASLGYMRWDNHRQDWVAESSYALDDQNQILKTTGNYEPNQNTGVAPTLRIKVVDNFWYIQFVSADKDIPQQVLTVVLTTISETIRNQDLGRIRSDIVFNRGLFKSEREPLVRSRIADELFRLLILEHKIRTARHYRYELADPPSRPQLEQTTEKKSPAKPNYKRTILAVVLGALILAVLAAFISERRDKSGKGA